MSFKACLHDKSKQRNIKKRLLKNKTTPVADGKKKANHLPADLQAVMLLPTQETIKVTCIFTGGAALCYIYILKDQKL